MSGQLTPSQDFGLLDAIPLGAFVTDADLRVHFWNACLEDWTHIPRDQIIGQRIDIWFPHLTQLKYLSRLHQIFEGGIPFSFRRNCIPISFQHNAPMTNCGCNTQP
ncbi:MULTISPECIES: PAS domain-containing protein [unclassified Leptolyngbya]|uniref:PAS domain-containing protein n=1 Tax=Leptolyngbya sp. PL-A3 TaxID=2933911 RepID=UPI001686691A|nr:PAS domain-containing protein [Leptolyngbya sp. FACHB-8]MBD2158145.1 PAS domain-containing protein [Leptolyngbya sp. FACHB-16]